MLKDREAAVLTPLAAMCCYAEPCHFSREFARRVCPPPPIGTTLPSRDAKSPYDTRDKAGRKDFFYFTVSRISS